ncbi:MULTISPECIES: plastocyanin/azurin family copper-binding protein [unclassified Polaromonas]|uniref:cupredoxin domain-containing protein n=1 Tax=unclassified Polaromonas TaxID=2638319 RepID=UPI000F080D7E|nr:MULTISPECIES: cupredoxin family protein [unclassified Polaromonas]AYQ28836.1 plastocyanin [Polaromonas sp. SP1]QGJ20908.1 plastocyanin [Polaromonas sp. Pch-P]
MKFQSALKLIAACTISIWAAAAFSHGDGARPAKAPAAVKKEQKPWGIAGDAKAVTRTVTLSMTDNMRFSSDKLSFKQGETVRFVIQNQGKLLHELVIGTKAELDAHAAMMVKFPGMEHDEPYMAHVPAGKSGGLVWTFNRAGDFDFACLIAGHYQAGMVGKITVAAR